MRALWWKLRTLFGRSRMEADLREELALHRELLERDIARDAAAGDAAAQASRRLGNTTLTTENSAREWGFPSFESLMRDVRYAARSLRANPAFSVTAILTLALGVGATVAIFTVVDTIVLRPLPYRDGDRLVSVYSSPPRDEARIPLSHPDFRDLRSETRALSHVVYARGEGLRVRGEMGAEGLIVAFVTDGLFPMLGTGPALGRALTADDERPGAERTIVLGHRVWMERFGGDPAILNTQLTTLDGTYTVVGIMPPEFAWPEWAQAWSPIGGASFDRSSLERRAFRVDARTLGRLAPGRSLRDAAAELETIGARLAAAHPEEDGELTLRATSLRDETSGQVRRPLFVLLGAVGGLLLIACANVSNLSLARASARAREIGVRLAIGASRRRIARQLLVESTLLSALGTALGVVAAHFAVRALLRLAPASLPRLAEVAVDERVLLFAVAVCAAAVLLFGLAPALALSTGNMLAAVKDAGRGMSSGRRGSRLQSAFVVAEIAIAVLLVVGSGLLVKSFARMRGADAGFDTARLVSLRIEPVVTRYPSAQQKLLLYDAIRDAVARIPGVERVSYINHSPATRSGVYTPLESDGEQTTAAGRQPSAAYRLVDRDYFATIGQRVVRGRALGAEDMTPHSTAVVVNQTLARQLWKDADPLGRRVVAFKQSSGPDAGQRVGGQVVGVVEDIKDYDLSESEPSLPEVYLPFPVNPWRSMFIAVRARGEPELLVPEIRRVVRSIDADLPVRRTVAVDQLMAERMAGRSFTATVVTAFGIVALLLASLGVYGVVAYAVSQRTQEIGVRSALGASPGVLVRAFVGRASRLAVLGVAVGLAASVMLSRAVESMLFGVARNDAATFAQVAAIILFVTAAASYVPARRALRVDPLIAMRGD